MEVTKCSPPSIQYEENWSEPIWNADVHLAAQPPKVLTLFDGRNSFKCHSYPCPPPVGEDKRSQLAYSEAFQFLSPKGVEDLRRVVDYNLKKHAMTSNSGRIPLSVRGMGYRSKFIRGMNQCPKALALLSSIAGVPLVPSSFETTWGHTNVGVVGAEAPVDQWHIDSVPFVLVILLSDMSGAIGGELEVVKKYPYQDAFQRIAETGNVVPKEELLVAKYPSQGCGILMQGSHMVHHVTPVLSAKEPRITVINSYQCSAPLYPDDTRIDFFRYEPETAYFQYARHRAIRAKNRLQKLIDSKQWILSPIELAKELKNVASELEEGCDILTGLKDDSVAFVQENKTLKSKM